MKFSSIAIIAALICLLLTMCKKDPEKEPAAICQHDSSVEGMKEWYYFRTGTWWVYQEQTTGELDTITVYYDWEGTNSTGTVGFEWYARSSWDGYDQFYTFNDSYSIHCLSTDECTCNKLERARGRVGDFVGAGRIFLYPLIEGNYTASNGGWCTLETIHNSYELNSTTYANVAEWDIPVDGSEDEVHTKYWISENFGIIRRKNLSLNTDWVLINSSIIQ